MFMLDGKDPDPSLVGLELKSDSLVVKATSPLLDKKALDINFMISITENNI